MAESVIMNGHECPKCRGWQSEAQFFNSKGNPFRNGNCASCTKDYAKISDPRFNAIRRIAELKVGNRSVLRAMAPSERSLYLARAAAEYDSQLTVQPAKQTAFDKLPVYVYSGPVPGMRHARVMMPNPAVSAAKREELVRAILEEHFPAPLYSVINNTEESGFDFVVRYQQTGILYAVADAKSAPVVTDHQLAVAYNLIDRGVQVWLINPGQWKRQIDLATKFKAASWRIT